MEDFEGERNVSVINVLVAQCYYDPNSLEMTMSEEIEKF
jgi:hypothetical protein